MFETLCSHCRGTGSIPGWELRSHMLHGVAKKKKFFNFLKLFNR